MKEKILYIRMCSFQM